MSVADLKRRGWTDKLVEQYLGEPDFLAPNPHYSRGGKMRLYLTRRVLSVEQSEAFGDDNLTDCRDRARRLSSRQTDKLKRTNNAIENCVISVRRIALQTLIKRAIKYHNTEFPDLKRPFLFEDDPDDLPEIMAACVQYASDKLSDHLKVAQSIAPYYEREPRKAIARKAYKAISNVYPSLSEECERYIRLFC